MSLVSLQEPLSQFCEVFAEACAAGIENPNAMTVSTVDSANRPRSRVVLLKDHDERGFVFYTNLNSTKGRHLTQNQNVCLNFYWRELNKQIIIEGTAEQVSEQEADEYFATRPRTSQLGAWASKQSQPLKSQAHLLAEVAKFEAMYLARKIPRPPHWSGFRVVPHYFEFWKAGTFRLHDRVAYELEDDNHWKKVRLNP